MNALTHKEFFAFNLQSDMNFAKKSLMQYRVKYSHICIVNGLGKYKMLATSIQTMMIILVLEKMIEDEISFRKVDWAIGKYENSFKGWCKTVIIPDFRLETMLAICDFCGVTLSEIKKLVLRNILVKNEMQYEKINYSKN